MKRETMKKYTFHLLYSDLWYKREAIKDVNKAISLNILNLINFSVNKWLIIVCYSKNSSLNLLCLLLFRYCNYLSLFLCMASLVAQLVKLLPQWTIQEIWVQSLGWEDPLEKGKATHSSILAQRIPWTV